MIPSENILKVTPVGMVIRPSTYSVDETMKRVASRLLRQGSTIYTRIDQQAELQKVGQHIPPLLFILFGNPIGSGALMAKNPLATLDLPLKIIVWEDHLKKVFVAYNSNTYIGDRYGLLRAVTLPLRLDEMITDVLAP